jgi:RNA recognition motif-containing protein
LSYFCTDEKLRQAFTPFGTVVFAQVLRDECGHSLGLGLVHMASSNDVERVFSAPQLFEVSGSRVDIWEPEELEDIQDEQRAFYVRRGTRAAQAGQDTGHEKSQKAFQRLAVLRHRLFQSMVPSSWTVKH